ncbi:neuroblast differentiation-associated protein AHNAK isoform X3 [Anarrhichthys ocellatus]|uniref:neuroblast differentiation-associated protein AHNAK isoform X3 n=1 Tax=Anarrhichthys ocellatus TaxID=433405 RepID=UPI0012EECFE8|nr:neuroblast differentiation-associated protein AHNAK-like isoform X3 [Anarrhichthys ocellatus]
MCDCFHLAFPNWQAASSGTAGRRLRAPEPGTEDDSTCDEPSQFTERPRPQGSSPVEEYPETEKYTDSDKECEAEHDRHHKSGSGKKTKKSGLGSMFEKRSTPKMSKLKEDHSPESGVIVKTAPDGCSEGLVYGGGGREGIFIKEVVPESPASKSLKLKEGDQILSATVYFDNVSYEDAVQILEHAQAYKMKLCLKRNPGVTETESAIESDVIPEEDVYVAEMREQGKTKRRSEARISWPKFPSFGKGRKSRFTRSHSSSEADEQRKLELSPTTSDTESPIKSQDTLKGKKKHKIKLSGLTKRGRISSSEDQDTDAPTSAQMLPTECLESPSGETPQVYVTEDLKVVEDLRLTEPQTVQHKVELISIASTLKTEDLTVALAGQESLSGIKSPDGKKKKKKKELSQLKINILGKDKSHKKDAKEKSSPKRLKTMGASIEIADQPENEKSDVIPSFESRTKLQGVQLALDDNTQIIERSVPKMELEISDVAFIQKSPQKGEEKTKKGKDIKQKQEAKRDPTFKLPKIGFSDIASEETIPKMNVNFEERTTKIEQLTTEGTEVKEDPFEQLSKSSLSRTKLPKREDIEIPGMEDMSKRTTVKIMKEPKTVSTRHYEDTQAETVQMSIDVDSVKEAVSKLPGFKLPKVDTSGMPIPEEITVIDANAQRISVKTPTKTKHEAHFSKFDITASPEISKTTIKLPKITPADLASDELLMVTQVDLKKTEKEYKAEPKQSDKEVYKREHIIIPGKESAQEATVLQTQGTQDNEGIKSDYISAATFKTKRAKITMPSFGIAKPDIKIPDIGIHLPKQNISEQNVDNIKGERTIFLQEVEISKTEARNKIGGVTSDVKIPEIDGIEYIDSAYGSPAKKDVGFRLTGFGVNLNADSPKADISCTDVGGEAKVVEAKEQTFKLAKFGEGTLNINVNVPDANEDINIDGAKIKTLDREEKGGKFHLPNLGISMPKVKGPTIDISLSKQDVNVTLPEAKAEVKLPEAPDSDITLGTIDVSNREQKIELEKPEFNVKHLRTEGELDGQGGKFKMPEFGVKMPKVKGPEFDLSLSKKDVDVTLPQAKAEVKLPYVEHTEPGIKIESKAPEIAIYKQDIKRSTSKFKMPTFKLPTVGVGTPNVSVEVRDMDKDVKIDGANRAAVNIEAPSVDIEGPSVDMKAIGTDHEGKESKLKMPHLGFTMPKVKGPQVNLSSSKKDVDVTLPEAKAEVKLPDVKLKESSAQVEIKAPEIEAQTSNVEGSPSKLKMPTFTLPKFGAATPKVSVEVPDVDKDIKIEGATVDITAPRIDTEGLSVDMKSKESELQVSGSKFKMPKFGISMPKVKGPEIDLSLSKKDIDVTLPEAKAEVKLPSVEVKEHEAVISAPDAPTVEVETKMKRPNWTFPKFSFSRTGGKAPDVDVKLETPKVDVALPEAKAEVELPDVKIKQPSATVDIKALEIEAKTGNVERSPSKLKMPTFTLPKFGAATPKVSVEVPDVDKDIQIEGATVDVTAPSIDTEDLSVDMKSKESEIQVSGSKFKMPKFGISMSKVKGPEIDLSLSKKDGDVTLPEAKAEVKLPSVEVKEHEAVISAPDAPTVEVETEMKRPNWTFPKLSFSSTGGKAPDVDDKLETPNVNVTPTEAKAEVQGPSGVILIEEPPAAKPDANLKKTKFSLPRFSFSKSSVKEPEVSAELPCVDVSLSEGQVIVKQSEMQIKAPELEAELDGQGSKFKFPKFGIALPKAKGPGEDLNASQEDAVITLPEVKAEVKLPQIEVKEPSASVEIKASETEAKSKDAGGSPLKFKMPTLKMSKFGAATYDITVEAPDADTDGAKLKEDVTVNIKGPSVDIKSDVSQAAITDSETPKTDTDAVGLGSPSKFQLPSFKMPKLSFSRSNPEDEHVPVDTESKADKQEMKVEPKEESKSPKVTFTSFGEILKNIDVEFDVPKTSENLETSKEVDETDEPSGEQLQAREKETKQDATKSPERTGWFKFPKFGLSSPSEPAKIPERDERKDEKSPAGETVDEEISPTCSVQSSDAFADISSAMTSEYGGFSLSSPTRVTVKYSDPTAAAGLGELHSNIITSTTKTELISVEPNLPEKITILSSGVSSSSEDTLRLESGKIHVITSNIQATPEAQHAKLLTAVQIQSAGGFPQGSEANEAASWTIEDSQSGKTTVFEKHFVRETSSERSESKETIVIRKQITRRFDSSEPISGETASSIQRLRDSMHSDKMRFFDGADE